jgi:methyl-accepting chemotaxis protein
MNSSWTFGRKLTAGYAVMVVFVILLGAIAVFALRDVVASKDAVLDHQRVRVDLTELHAETLQRRTSVLGYLLTRDDKFLDERRDARARFAALSARLGSQLTSSEEQRLFDEILRASEAQGALGDEAIELAQSGADSQQVVANFEARLGPAQAELDERVRALVELEDRLLTQGRQAATDNAARAISELTALALGATIVAILFAVALSRMLARQVGLAVGHVQSSSTELQAAATQQASGAKEQASAMNEISTTISELVATSRQIAESAQRVAQIAERTAAAVRNGDETVERGQEAIAGIRRQVDLVVTHMLELGKKSQEIGTVLDILSELAEQTNILAINATIEAAGAGETGKRFAVVADEIRKLADRVADSTKDVRALIDDVRSAVNTTVMVTENGAKAVEAGSRQFAEVAAAFREIATQVVTTTDAAREIELSTKQQATAAEQVRVAVTDVAQATRETEASSSQTLQTASQLAGMSRDLQRLIQREAA